MSEAAAIAAILFDMDGVLIDSEPAHAAATSDALVALGLDPITPATYRRYFLGRTDWTGFDGYLRAVGRDDVPLADIVRVKAACYARRFPSVPLFADGVETLRACAARGLQVGVVSGGRRAEVDATLARAGVVEQVAVALSGDDVPAGKPDPAPYLIAARHLGLPPARCLVVEDAPSGVAAARAAGMPCLAVDREGAPERLAGARSVVGALSPDAVAALLASLGGA